MLVLKVLQVTEVAVGPSCCSEVLKLSVFALGFVVKLIQLPQKLKFLNNAKLNVGQFKGS